MRAGLVPRSELEGGRETLAVAWRAGPRLSRWRRCAGGLAQRGGFMDALKQIPQAFFEFFARLIPGFVALTLWMGLFGGAGQWPDVLNAVVAGRLTDENIVSVALIMGLSVCYVAGQLIAPFGKLVQRLTEGLVSLVCEVGERLRKKAKLDHTSANTIEHALPASSVRGGDYDWLRAKFPEQGALVAKIRAEYTMFYAVSAIFAAALVAQILRSPPFAAGEIVILLVFAVAWAARGFHVTKTCREAARKLRDALQ